MGVGTAGTLIFDEVDSGVGGATADAVGERLERLGAEKQILVVTHSPQVAARGDDHLKVEKQSEAEMAATLVSRLQDEDRREEVARMLSGQAITDEARGAADRLMQGVRMTKAPVIELSEAEARKELAQLAMQIAYHDARTTRMTL